MKILITLALTFAAGGGKENPAYSVLWQEKVFEIQNQIVDIHPFLAQFYPIALVRDDSLYVYDADTVNQRYVFVKQTSVPFPMPAGIQASFPLQCYDGRTSCVITEQVFASLQGYSIIFHEFMHCTQWETCEPKLKEILEVNRQAMTDQNYMWELNHPFPYQDSAFVETYVTFMQALDGSDSLKISECRAEFKNLLDPIDYEYMVWQEWKEGFARRIENKILDRLRFEENHYGQEQPFSRITFYEGGSRYIEYLTSVDPELETDIEVLFERMLTGQEM